jgi:protein TonB
VAGGAAEAEAARQGGALRQANVAGLAYQVAIEAAIAAAREYPPAEREARIAGTTRIEVSVARDGRLLQARVAESSGSEALDGASLAAARRARLPAAPAELAGESFRFEVGLAYGPDAP